jgi:hypothetical protein
MANQRSPGKTLIGAQASAEIWDGVDEWLENNRPKTVTDFVLAACIEKLRAEGIEVDLAEALRDRRGRIPANAPTRPVSYWKTKKKG